MSGIFTELEKLLAVGDEVSLKLTKNKEEGLQVVVLTKLPSSKATDERTQKIRAGLCAPIVINSTASELDEKFSDLINDVAMDRNCLNNSFSNARDKSDEVMASANKAVNEKGKKESKAVTKEASEKKVKSVDAPAKPKTTKSLV